MKTRAAVAFEAKKPLEIVEVDLEGPKAGEVLVEIMATGICHTDAYTLDGFDSEGIFPSILGMKARASCARWDRALPACSRAIMSSRSTRPNAASAKAASVARPTYAPRSARRRARG